MPIVELPFVYDVQIVKPRGRNGSTETLRVREDVPFEIPAVAGADAPVVTRWVHRDSYDECTPETRNRHYPNGPYVTERRVHEGRAFQPTGSHEAGLDLDEYASTAVGVRRNGFRPRIGLPILPVMRDSYSRDRTASDFPSRSIALTERARAASVQVVKVVGNDRERRLAEAIEAYRVGLIVVDGRVWTREGANEPDYKVIFSPRNHDVVQVEVSMGRDPADYVHHFRADRFDDALAFAEFLKRHHEVNGRRVGLEVCGDRIDVLRPELITFDDGVALAEQAMAFWSIPANRSAVEAWNDEADAIEGELLRLRRETEHDVAWARNVIGALERFRARMPEPLPDGMHVAGEILERSSSALLRWEFMERDRRPDLAVEEDEEIGLVLGMT